MNRGLIDALSRIMPQQPFHRFLTIAIIVVVTYHLWSIGRVPALPTDDDGAYAAAAYQIWQTGYPGVPGYRTVVGMGQNIYVLGHIGAALQGFLMALFGVGIRTAFLPSVLAGIGLLFLTFLIARRLWESQTALIAALLLSLSGVFFNGAHSARPDMFVTLFFMIGLWLVLRAAEGEPAWNLTLAGLVMGLAGDLHPNGFLLAPIPLIFWVLLTRPRWGELSKGVALYGIGGVAGIVWWIGRHYLPDPTGFRRQSTLHGLTTHGVKLLDHGFDALRIELQRYLDWFWYARAHRHAFEGLVVLLSGVLLAWRGDRRDKAIVGAWIVLFLIASAFMSNQFGWYLIFAWPLFALWIARMVTLAGSRQIGYAIFGLLILAYLVNHGLWLWKAMREEAFETRIVRIREAVPKDAPVLASAGLWFALWDRDFTHEPYLPFRVLESRAYPETGPTGWEVEQKKLGWRYIVAYGNLQRFLDPDSPIDQILAVEPWKGREAEVRDARRYALEHLKVVSRLDSAVDPITIFSVH